MELGLDKNLFSSDWSYFNFSVNRHRPCSNLSSFSSFLLFEPFECATIHKKGNYSMYEYFLPVRFMKSEIGQSS
jgi:hypothetical protein